MIFSKLICPQCSDKEFFIDSEKTTNLHYERFKDEIKIIRLEDEAPFYPDLLLLECKSCGHEEEANSEQFLKMSLTNWSEVAWKRVRDDMLTAYKFDTHVTNYLLDKDLGKFITNEDLKKNPMFKEYFKIKNG